MLACLALLQGNAGCTHSPIVCPGLRPASWAWHQRYQQQWLPSLQRLPQGPEPSDSAEGAGVLLIRRESWGGVGVLSCLIAGPLFQAGLLKLCVPSSPPPNWESKANVFLVNSFSWGVKGT